MRFDLANEPVVSALYKCSKNFDVFASSYREMNSNSKYQTTGDRVYRERKSVEYCNHIGLGDCPVSESVNKLTQFDIKCFRRALRDFRPEVISSRFVDEAARSGNQLLSSIEGTSLFEVLGDCSGVMVLDEIVAVYSVSEEGCFFEVYKRDEPSLGASYYYQFGNGCFYYRQSDANQFPRAMLPILVLLFKKFAEVRTQLIAGNVRRPSLDSGEALFNKAPFSITQTDCTWFTTYTSDESFMVRGFWRLQACGQNHKDHKLVYINPFEKHGYHRQAKVLAYAA